MEPAARVRVANLCIIVGHSPFRGDWRDVNLQFIDLDLATIITRKPELKVYLFQ